MLVVLFQPELKAQVNGLPVAEVEEEKPEVDKEKVDSGHG